MITRKRLGYVLWVCAMVGILAQGTWANNNFKAQADKTGCDSITPDGIEECRRVQRAKNEACNQRTECDPSRQERDADIKTNHDTPTKQAENRLENCRKTIAVKFDELPSEAK